MLNTFISLLLCGLLLLPSGCGSASTEASLPGLEETQVTLHFVSQQRAQSDSLITTEERTISYDPAAGLESYVLQALFSGPQQEGAVNIIPSNLSVKELKRQDSALLVTLSFSGEKPKENFDFMLVKTSIALTLLDLQEVQKVGVYMDEVEYDDSGLPADLFRKEDVITPETLSTITEREITLYLPDLKNGMLVPTSATITSGSDTSMLSAIVTELFKTADNVNLNRLVYNQNARLISVFNEDGVVYLNFSEAIEPAECTPQQLELCIYGLVNSICAMDESYTVMLWVKGKTNDSYMQYTSLDSFFFREELVTQQGGE